MVLSSLGVTSAGWSDRRVAAGITGGRHWHQRGEGQLLLVSKLEGGRWCAGRKKARRVGRAHRCCLRLYWGTGAHNQNMCCRHRRHFRVERQARRACCVAPCGAVGVGPSRAWQDIGGVMIDGYSGCARVGYVAAWYKGGGRHERAHARRKREPRPISAALRVDAPLGRHRRQGRAADVESAQALLHCVQALRHVGRAAAGPQRLDGLQDLPQLRIHARLQVLQLPASCGRTRRIVCRAGAVVGRHG
ncbi:MAG: hypothetical protein J3K34DRAFT_462771 [Monoraphidium minutum]|nr:MAG: hypothetical protein J3K34DRAFT_462771 [Monoraphidium minutum]